MSLYCSACGVAIFKKATGPAPKYCSGACRARACDARAKQDGRFRQWADTVNRKREESKPTRPPCLHCGGPLVRRPGIQYCGAAECQRERDRLRQGKHVQARRARLASATVEMFDNAEIYERDGWLCQICGESIDRGARYPHPRSVSLDHIVPLSKGGAHSRANTQCAHFGCNRRKGVAAI